MHIYPHDRVLTNAAVKDMAQAHGLYLAQNFQLNAIEKAYPDLMTRSRVARLQFSAQFGQSITNMDALLSRAGPQEWERIKSETKSKIAPMLQTSSRPSR
jgi:hypothetical protein